MPENQLTYNYLPIVSKFPKFNSILGKNFWDRRMLNQKNGRRIEISDSSMNILHVFIAFSTILAVCFPSNTYNGLFFFQNEIYFVWSYQSISAKISVSTSSCFCTCGMMWCHLIWADPIKYFPIKFAMNNFFLDFDLMNSYFWTLLSQIIWYSSINNFFLSVPCRYHTSSCKEYQDYLLPGTCRQ